MISRRAEYLNSVKEEVYIGQIPYFAIGSAMMMPRTNSLIFGGKRISRPDWEVSAPTSFRIEMRYKSV